MNHKFIEQNWQQLAQYYRWDEAKSKATFERLAKAYQQKNRHYHTLLHLENMFNALQTYELQIVDKQVVMLSIFFHDVVYATHYYSRNEERSAVYADKCLTALGVPTETIAKVKTYILATQHHQPAPDDQDLQLLLDVDLAILGSNETNYKTYTQAIRQEYAYYPDFIYTQGRKKVLKNFLERPRIFYLLPESLEIQARENITKELG